MCCCSAVSDVVPSVALVCGGAVIGRHGRQGCWLIPARWRIVQESRSLPEGVLRIAHGSPAPPRYSPFQHIVRDPQAIDVSATYYCILRQKDVISSRRRCRQRAGGKIGCRPLWAGPRRRVCARLVSLLLYFGGGYPSNVRSLHGVDNSPTDDSGSASFSHQTLQAVGSSTRRCPGRCERAFSASK